MSLDIINGALADLERLREKLEALRTLYRVQFENHSPGARPIAVNPTARPVPRT
jgi:hypothetical protein